MVGNPIEMVIEKSNKSISSEVNACDSLKIKSTDANS
jgi:hypothetical protein